MNFTLPPLPYPTDALEPFLSKKTVEYHYGKHHAAYVENANKLVRDTPFKDNNDKNVLKIKEIVCSYCHISEDDLISNSRKPLLVYARNLCYYIIRKCSLKGANIYAHENTVNQGTFCKAGRGFCTCGAAPYLERL